MNYRSTFFERLFGKYLNPFFDYFWNELKITPAILFLILSIFLFINRFKKYKKNENPDEMTKYKITNRKLNIYNLWMTIICLFCFIIFTIWDQIRIMKS